MNWKDGRGEGGGKRREKVGRGEGRREEEREGGGEKMWTVAETAGSLGYALYCTGNLNGYNRYYMSQYYSIVIENGHM